jgi:hypothetical protein
VLNQVGRQIGVFSGELLECLVDADAMKLRRPWRQPWDRLRDIDGLI